MFALCADRHGVGECVEVAGGFPDSLMGDYRAVYAYDVLSALNMVVPPKGFDIVFELCSIRTIVVKACESSIELAAWVDKAFSLAKGGHFVDCEGHSGEGRQGFITFSVLVGLNI